MTITSTNAETWCLAEANTQVILDNPEQKRKETSMTSLDRRPAQLTRSNRVGHASLGIGVLTLLWTVVPLFGLGLGADTATTISLGLGALAVMLGTVGLYRHWTGHATTGWTSAWGMVLGFVFGLAPTVFLILAFTSAG